MYFFDASTQWCGRQFSRTLSSNDTKFKEIQKAFINKYSIDMTLFDRPFYYQYNSVNDWFTRSLAPGVRPVASPSDDNVVVSPADARLMVFANVKTDHQIWLKGNFFTIAELLGPLAAKPSFETGAMTIVRLAPQDYHRFHVPVSGNLTQQYFLEGTLHSVNADGMTSQNYAIYNQRTVNVIRTPNHGDVAYVAIGATCVGSVEMLHQVGDQVVKGDEFGYFQFGGSTVVMVFEEGQMVFDDDLLMHSTKRVETLAKVNTRIGRLQ